MITQHVCTVLHTYVFLSRCHSVVHMFRLQTRYAAVATSKPGTLSLQSLLLRGLVECCCPCTLGLELWVVIGRTVAFSASSFAAKLLYHKLG